MRVVLADDQAKVRSAMRLLLEQEEEIEVLGEAVDATDLVDWVEASSPDLVLLDWELPGFEPSLLRALRELRPSMDVIALSGRPESRRAALEAGAHAFVSKGDPPERLLEAVADYRGQE
jgi:DNA-binding NarL/FixJ family response regulator